MEKSYVKYQLKALSKLIDVDQLKIRIRKIVTYHACQSGYVSIALLRFPTFFAIKSALGGQQAHWLFPKSRLIESSSGETFKSRNGPFQANPVYS